METNLLDISIMYNWDILINENTDDTRWDIRRRIYTIIDINIANELLNTKDNQEKENILKKHKII